MEEIRCIKCGRPLRDPESIARGMGPECAGASGGYRKRYRCTVRLHSSAVTPTLFTLVGEAQSIEELPPIEEVSPRNSALVEILMQFPTELIDLVLSAPAAGAIALHVKNYSKEKKKLERFYASRQNFARNSPNVHRVTADPSGRACPTTRDNN